MWKNTCIIKGGAVYEIYHPVYPIKQNQTGFIIENYGAHKETSKINVGLHVCFSCQKKPERWILHYC